MSWLLLLLFHLWVCVVCVFAQQLSSRQATAAAGSCVTSLRIGVMETLNGRRPKLTPVVGVDGRGQ
jgi:hypothetical protein